MSVQNTFCKIGFRWLCAGTVKKKKKFSVQLMLLYSIWQHSTSLCHGCLHKENKLQYLSVTEPSFHFSFILTLPSQYIFLLLVFVVRHRNLFVANSEIHDAKTRFNHNLHLPTTKLTLVQKGVFYSGSKMYNLLPPYIKSEKMILINLK